MRNLKDITSINQETAYCINFKDVGIYQKTNLFSVGNVILKKNSNEVRVVIQKNMKEFLEVDLEKKETKSLPNFQMHRYPKFIPEDENQMVDHTVQCMQGRNNIVFVSTSYGIGLFRGEELLGTFCFEKVNRRHGNVYHRREMIFLDDHIYFHDGLDGISRVGFDHFVESVSKRETPNLEKLIGSDGSEEGVGREEGESSHTPVHCVVCAFDRIYFVGGDSFVGSLTEGSVVKINRTEAGGYPYLNGVKCIGSTHRYVLIAGFSCKEGLWICALNPGNLDPVCCITRRKKNQNQLPFEIKSKNFNVLSLFTVVCLDQIKLMRIGPISSSNQTIIQEIIEIRDMPYLRTAVTFSRNTHKLYVCRIESSLLVIKLDLMK